MLKWTQLVATRLQHRTVRFPSFQNQSGTCSHPFNVAQQITTSTGRPDQLPRISYSNCVWPGLQTLLYFVPFGLLNWIEWHFLTQFTLNSAWSCPRRRRARGDDGLLRQHSIHGGKISKRNKQVCCFEGMSWELGVGLVAENIRNVIIQPR